MKDDRNTALDRVPHHVASGVVLLARLSDAAAETYVSGIGDDDPVPRAKAWRVIRVTRRDGTAVSLSGRIEGAASVAGAAG